MKQHLEIHLDSNLLSRFEMAAKLNNETTDMAIETMIRAYISKTFAHEASIYDQSPIQGTPTGTDQYYGKAVARIPKWAKKQDQINHKIIRAYLQLAENGDVFYSELVNRCNDNELHPDVYVPTFSSNFAQMKFDNSNSHGKVFEVSKEGIVSVWGVVADTIMRFKDCFLLHSTDIGYINRNHQRNMGKTKAKGTDHLQFLYLMRCENCDHEYFANGSDIFHKKCPNCQGGANTGK